ncbi:MAG TPA: protein-methionine-sulfoxide reductase catalytic subunit MsrP [Kofleriaceae bacterium]|jgi:sulfoxide reductase catalytic subunit YedY|nr:protein-methionine-sulfoxide reductase catalytic subunit MsrP [Kofleriaceae bacterium]
MTEDDKRLEREITPRALYLDRRTVMRGGLVAATAVATGWLYRQLNGVARDVTERPPLRGLVRAEHATDRGFWVDEPQTSLASITNYNNFYEFTTNKDGVAKAAAAFRTDGWQLAVGGLVHQPRVFDLDALRAISPPEERVYRMRCVEAWSMVIPWAGLPLAKLLARVEPMSSAKYVAFETLHDPARMPGQRTKVLDWPYVEGLRLDEAMHPLALLATGLYGEELPPQDGAPVRLVTPWKYGFKGIKSIVKITLTDREPPSTWQRYAPSEYGFYANVNPHHAHPRWSQATEQRIGEVHRRDTMMFNGYGDQVASLYAGMDLNVTF